MHVFIYFSDERWHGGVSPVAQRAKPVLLQTTDKSHPFSIFLPGIPAHDTCDCCLVPHWLFVVKLFSLANSQNVFHFGFSVSMLKTLKPAVMVVGDVSCSRKQ